MSGYHVDVAGRFLAALAGSRITTRSVAALLQALRRNWGRWLLSTPKPLPR